MNIEEPKGPWFVNVHHFKFLYRPYCQSPVDYDMVRMSGDMSKVNCAKCLREVKNMTEREKEIAMLGTI